MNAPNRRPGTLDWWSHRLELQLKPGPSEVAALFAWPAMNIKDVMEDQDRRACMEKHLVDGVRLDTLYSGRGTAESAFRKVWLAANAESSRLDKRCEWWSGVASDLKPMAQRVLAAHGKGSRPEHVFGDMNMFLPGGVRNELNRLMPRAAALQSREGSCLRGDWQGLAPKFGRCFPRRPLSGLLSAPQWWRLLCQEKLHPQRGKHGHADLGRRRDLQELFQSRQAGVQCGGAHAPVESLRGSCSSPPTRGFAARDYAQQNCAANDLE